MFFDASAVILTNPDWTCRERMGAQSLMWICVLY